MKIKSRFDFALYMIGLALSLILLFTSCAANGYGCHGRGKEISGTSHAFRMR